MASTSSSEAASGSDGDWWTVALFFSANVLFGAGLFAHAFLYNFYLDDLQHSESVFGIAAAALTAGGLLALLPAGLIVDRVGSTITYLTAAALAAVGLLSGAFVVQPVPVYAAAFVAGAGTTTWRVAMGPIIMQIATVDMRSRVFSWNVALLVASGAVWTAASGALPSWLQDLAGFSHLNAIRGVLVLGAAGTALSAPLFLFARGRRRRWTPRDPQRRLRPDARLSALIRQLRISRSLTTLVGLVALWMIAGALVIPFFNIYFQRVHELSIDRIGLIFALAQAITALVIVGSGLAASRLGARRALVAWMLLFAPVLWSLAAVSAVQFAIMLFLIQGLVPPATNPLIDQILLEYAPADKRGAISSWRNGATELSGLIGATVGGVLLEAASFRLLFGVAGLVALLGALALGGAIRGEERRRPE
jgi:MFS family permease